MFPLLAQVWDPNSPVLPVLGIDVGVVLTAFINFVMPLVGFTVMAGLAYYGVRFGVRQVRGSFGGGGGFVGSDDGLRNDSRFWQDAPSEWVERVSARMRRGDVSGAQREIDWYNKSAGV